MTLVRRVVLFAVALAATAGAGRAAPSLERLLSAPFPTSLVAAPRGARFAWVFDERGARNIWVAGPPRYEARRLTAYEGDDGRELRQLAWTPDGEALVYVRGGAANRDGEHPNPTSDPAGAKEEIWTLALVGGVPRRLAEGSGPVVSPRGDRVVFLEKGDLWSVPLDGSAPAERLADVRGQARQPRFSPDGRRLAFVSDRGDHAFIGVLDLDAGSLRYLDPSVDVDAHPSWSPEGDRIAWIREPASEYLFTFGPRREATPWSIRVADVATGRAETVFAARTGRGSVFRPLVADRQIFWTADGHLVFPWEADGWLHLYAVAVAGGEPRLLTPGPFEVEYAAATSDGAAVVFNSNEDDPERRHLFRVTATSSRPERLTSGEGIEWAPAPLSDGRTIALLRSDARLPARPALLREGGAPEDIASEALPDDFPADELVVPRPVRFAAADGMEIPAQLFLPPGPAAGRRPAVVFFHGGSRRQMLLGWHYMGYYHNAYAFNQYLATRGYVVLSVNYRSGIGYGLEFREAIGYGAHGASELADVLGAGLYLRGRDDVDPERIGLWGGSYGGYLTALGLARASHLFAAGVDLHGVHDWNVVIRNFAPSYDPLERPEMARRAFEASPLAHVETWRSPVLLVHGDDDRNVPFGETVRLVVALRRRGVEVEQLVFPDEVHGFLLHRRWLEAFERAASFFDRRLGPPRK